MSPFILYSSLWIGYLSWVIVSRLELNNLNNHKSFMISCISCSAASHGFQTFHIHFFSFFRQWRHARTRNWFPKKKFRGGILLKSIGPLWNVIGNRGEQIGCPRETMSRYNYSAVETVGKPLKATPRKGAGRQTDRQTCRQGDETGRRQAQTSWPKQTSFAFWPTLGRSSVEWGAEQELKSKSDSPRPNSTRLVRVDQITK